MGLVRDELDRRTPNPRRSCRVADRTRLRLLRRLGRSLESRRLLRANHRPISSTIRLHPDTLRSSELPELPD